jgi:hypothetical protein
MKMIDPSLLTAEEVDYLNNYHELCRQEVPITLNFAFFLFDAATFTAMGFSRVGDILFIFS